MARHVPAPTAPDPSSARRGGGAARAAAASRAPSPRAAGAVGLAATSALLGGASVMSQAAADARFLSELGPARLGLAVALSSALLAVVLAAVGGLSDRAGRGRVLASLCALAAVTLAMLAALAPAAQAAAAWIGFLGAKQLAAAADLAFWMAASEQLDARQSVRALPRLAAASGLGGAVSAALAVPLARLGGASAVLLGAAALLALAAATALALPAVRHVGGAVAGRSSGVAAGPSTPPSGRSSPLHGSALPALGALFGRTLREGVRCVGESPLARQLAVLVAVGGAFSALVYLQLSAAAAARHAGDEELAALLATVRSVAQVVTLAAQLIAAPWVLRRLGTGGALLLSPLWALAGAGLLAAWPVLAAAALVSVVARGLDQALETPAQKLVHVLLPPASRGRVVGAIEGVAKRGGAICAGLGAWALVGHPRAAALILASVAALWVAVATRMARRLPALAVAAPDSQGAAPGTTTLSRGEPWAGASPRVLAALRDELDGGPERQRRALEVLVQLARAGHVAPVTALWGEAVARGSAALWRAAAEAIAALPAARLPRVVQEPLALPSDREARRAAIAACALACRSPRGTGAAAAKSAARDDDPRDDDPRDDDPRDDDPRDDDCARLAELTASWLADPERGGQATVEELRHGDAATRLAAAEWAVLTARRALAQGAPLVAACWPLVAVVRRANAAPAVRPRALELLAELVAATAALGGAELVLLRGELRELALRGADRAGQPAPPAAEAAAALAVLAALEPPGRAAVDAVALAARALGDDDEPVAAAAEALLERAGAAAMAELLVVVGYGRRAARDRAAALLRRLPVTPAALDDLVARELGALERTCLAAGALAAATTAGPPGAVAPLLARRLDERAQEIAHTVLLLVAAARRSPAVAAAAERLRHARGRHERARALAVLDATLPRPLALRLIDAIDERSPRARAGVVAARLGVTVPAWTEAVTEELRGGDPSTRGLVLRGLSGAALAAHRQDIDFAARQAARTADAASLLSRLTGGSAAAAPARGDDMPSHVETLIALAAVPLLAELSTRQLEELARRARWRGLAAGQVVAVQGQPLEALVVVESGALTTGSRRLGAGQVVDELAWVAPRAPAHDVVAAEPARVLVLERAAFDELSDDVPGLGAALCRALGERLRAAAQE